MFQSPCGEEGLKGEARAARSAARAAFQSPCGEEGITRVDFAGFGGIDVFQALLPARGLKRGTSGTSCGACFSFQALLPARGLKHVTSTLGRESLNKPFRPSSPQGD